jgi:hypothetical protein
MAEKHFSYKKERMFTSKSGKHRPIKHSETYDLDIFTPKKKSIVVGRLSVIQLTSKLHYIGCPCW